MGKKVSFLLCLVSAGVFFGEIYFFRPAPIRNLPKFTWLFIAILCGILTGIGLFFLYRRILRKIPAPGYTAAGLFLMTGALVLLPGPHHLDISSNPLSAIPLRITILPGINSGQATITNIFVDEKRVDWPSVCAATGDYAQSTNFWLFLRKMGDQNKPAGAIECQLFPPQIDSRLSVDFADQASADSVVIYLGKQSFSGSHLDEKLAERNSFQTAIPVTPGAMIARAIEFLAFFLFSLLLVGCIYSATAVFRREPNHLFSWLLNSCLVLALAGLVTLANLTDYSFIKNIESKDAGVFLYMGQAILAGKMPYRDVWDHKPPLVFYFNAAGLAISNGSAWGVWGLEVILLIISAWLLFWVIQRRAGAAGAVAGVLLWGTGLFILFRIDETNVPETWGIFFQSLALLVIDRMVDQAPNGKSHRPIVGLFLTGLICGLLFLLKQVLISIGLALMIVILVKSWRKHSLVNALIQFAWFILGVGLALAVCLFYFWMRGALVDLFDVAFLYNFLYVSASTTPYYINLLNSLKNPLWPVSVIPCIGWVAGIVHWLRTDQPQKPLVFQLVLVAFPLEILLAALSGRNFDYYYNAQLYCIAMLGGGLASEQFQILRNSLQNPSIIRFREPAGAILTMLYLCLMVVFLGYSLPNSAGGQPGRNTQRMTLEFIQNNTSSGDAVLMWGNEAALNFYSQRPSPTRYFYQDALFTCHYLNKDRAARFLSDLTNDPPALIVDTLDPRMPAFEQVQSQPEFLAWAKAQSCSNYSTLWKSIDFIQRHYQYMEKIGRWKIYKRI